MSSGFKHLNYRHVVDFTMAAVMRKCAADVIANSILSPSQLNFTLFRTQELVNVSLTL